MTFKQRVEPFLALIEARYAPLLFVALPQSYSVFLWLISSSAARGNESFTFAVLGAAGFELVYVGTIAWAEGRTNNSWVWGTALTALVFSVMVSIRVYENEGWWSLLHAGFPIVAFAYTMTIHAAAKKNLEETTALKADEEMVLGLNRKVNEQAEMITAGRAENKRLSERINELQKDRALELNRHNEFAQRANKDRETLEEELVNLRARVEELQEERTAAMAEQMPEFYDSQTGPATNLSFPNRPLLPVSDATFAADGGSDVEAIRQEFKQTRNIACLYRAARAGVSKNTMKQWFNRYAREGVELGNHERAATFSVAVQYVSTMMKDNGIFWE